VKSLHEESLPPARQKHDPRVFAEHIGDTIRIRHVAITGLFVLAVFYTLYFGRPFFLPVTLALFLNLLFSPAVRALGKWHIPQGVGAALVLVVVLGIIVYALTKVSQPAAEWLQKAPNDWQQFERKMDGLLRPAVELNKAARKVQDVADGTEGEKNTPKVEVKSSTNLMTYALSWTKDFVTQSVVLVILLYFFLASGDMFPQKLVKLLPRRKDKQRAVTIAHETERAISTYLFTVAIINCCLGACVGLIMLFVGMPNPLMWGVMAALLNFIPYFGPLVGVGILAVAGLVQFDSWTHGILPSICYLCLHGMEANFITPTVLGRRLILNPVMVFLSLMFWSWLWGVVGAFLAVPILMACKIVCDHVEGLSPISDLLGP
jgi:predicted PurR-regulated permease PerM